MRIRDRKVLICNCEVSMALDGGRLAGALGADPPPTVHTQLCRAQQDAFRRAVAEGSPVLVGCTQEAPLFEEVRDEFGPETDVRYVNIRETAGWAEDGPAALPKIAALLAEAAVDVPPTPTVPLESGGTCLVYGDGEVALQAALRLQDRLTVTLLLRDPQDAIPRRSGKVPVYTGLIRQVAGRLGAFDVVIDGHAAVAPSSRAAFVFHTPRDQVRARADLILDLTGGTPLVPAPDKRDGYLRPDPGSPAAIERALFDLTVLVGEFEKPRYVDFEPVICAHSRSGRIGCTRCLEVCPASAIEPYGESVRIDPYLCGGCGACHSVCPTGAASYDYPRATALIERLQTLIRTYRASGGHHPVLLVLDERHGGELVSMSSRFGRGLPANVLPFQVNEVSQLGLETLLSAFAFGAERIQVLVPPRRTSEIGGFEATTRYVAAVLEGLGYGTARIELLTVDDPDELEAKLHGQGERPGMPQATFRAVDGKRTQMRLALDALHDAAPAPVDQVPLPAGAPFGRAIVDVPGCTLCLACVSVCPTGAFQDDPDRPRLAFQEDACVQCGLCVATCPENVIRLEPRLNFAPEAKQAVLVKEEEPATCIRCGKAFGTRATIERIVEKVAAKHAMFQDPAAIERIRMCEDCRVVVQFEAPAPFAAEPRRRPRTTEDDLREREAARRQRNGEHGPDDA